MTKTPASALTHRSRQLGSVAVNATIAFSLIIVLLIGTELGYLFYQKRELQKAVDLAALAGAQSVEPTRCDSARAAARANANGSGSGESDSTRNLPRGFSLSDEQIVCGHWDAAYTEERHFRPGETDHNAVHITIDAAPPSLLPFFPGTRQIRVEALAAVDTPMAAFSVGSRLARVGDSLLGDLLKGIGLDLTGTSLVSYDGLAQAQVTPRGLLEALGIPVDADIGIGEFNDLLAAREVALGDLLDAVVTVAGESSLLGANVALLNALQARLGVSDLLVQLGSLSGASGLFAQIEAPTTSAALDVGVNALDLVYSAIGVATKNHAVAVDLGSIANLVSAKVVVIEPPSVAMGGIGATAYTAQVRAFVDVDTGSLPVIGSAVRVKLPIMIDLVNGRGTITGMCSADLRSPVGEDRAEIEVQASVAKVCVGRPGANPANENEIFSTRSSCETDLANEQLLRVSLLGVNLASLNTHFDIDALELRDRVVLAEGETGTVGNNLLLGSTLQNITDALLAVLLGEALDQGPSLSLSQRQALAQQLWNEQGAACSTRSCRIARMEAIQAEIENATNGLGGFLGGLVGDTLGIVADLLTLDVLGLLQGVGNLVGGLLGAVGDLLGGLIGGCTALIGSNDPACVNKIASDLGGDASSGSGGTVPNAIVALVAFIFQVLQPILDSIGNAILTPLLRDVLGINLGEVDVHLRTLNCQAQARLVY
ncbi:TadG family pilus assembly protein [Hydrogenophaga electricum]|uniref:DUF2134 domain-containing protein n=1 Tax=Hydrogenophaga electricum TaxID=1230953 RepID=A0ABQ6C2X4_9BURK|nr:TadG family pilus assembly protein [Hydrogenophaga electricum]GLS14499.1 hypothetical protein GCM10007935_19300 [Hydrogenophaga electricum]